MNSRVANLIRKSVRTLSIGAILARLAFASNANADSSHWAFQPIRDEQPPKTMPTAGPGHPIDRFIAARLSEVELGLAEPAGSDALLRRLFIDLIGLPPSADEIEAFRRDTEPGAVERWARNLMARPEFGERWAQHWLDVARFAESDGFEHDKLREEAWRYRDWVIKAFNEDMPYDVFVERQIAGDLVETDVASSHRGTAFLLSGPDMPDINLVEERRHTVLNEMASTVGSAFLGLGVGCAQCHDHKYDPISQEEFYSLRAFFSDLEIPKRFDQLPAVYEVDRDRTEPARMRIRGDFRRPGKPTPPGFPSALAPAGSSRQNGPSDKTRLDLAHWLTNSENPLTARVMVNRIWGHLMGRPLVESTNDFGTQGAEPSHPALLDWLARAFMREEWSMKRLIALIVTSKSYQQTSVGSDSNWETRLERDPTNELYSRASRKRLSGEALRDVMLSISGELNRSRGGPGARPPLPDEVTVTLLKNQWPVTKDASEHDRRSVYLFARRNLRFPMFEVFDRPDALESCGLRHESTTAPQALTQFNSEFSWERATAIARRHVIEPSLDRAESAIETLVLRILNRKPNASEKRLSLAFFRENLEEFPRIGTSEQDRETLALYCLTLLNSNGFLYVD